MSKIGQAPITIPAEVTLELKGARLVVKANNDTLSFDLPRQLSAERQDNLLLIKRKNDQKQAKSLHGLYRVLIANAVAGVTKAWEKRLHIEGTGYNVKLQGEDLVLKVGYSHEVVFKKVEGVKFQVEGNNKIVIMGADRQLVGQVAHQIKVIKKPDAYKGKGIRYEGEKLRLKPGKKAKAAGAE